jgi:alkylhydroperoxidase family enzyme
MTMAALRPIDFADLEPALQDALRPRYERLGYLGDFFRVMAHQPAALLHFDRFTEETKRALGPAHAELIALTAATRLGNDYERHQHERLAVALGQSSAWVADVERLVPRDLDTGLDEAERAIQGFVLASIDTLVPPVPETRVNASVDAFGRVVEVVGDSAAAAVALLAARFVGHALVARACALMPPVPSIFADEERTDAGI